MRLHILLSGCILFTGSAFAWSHQMNKVGFCDNNAKGIDMPSAPLSNKLTFVRNDPGATLMRPFAGSNVVTPPLCETFDNFRSGMEYEDFSRYFKVIDSNNDGRLWRLYNYTAEDRPTGRCAYLLFPMEESGGQADDWLVTRGIQLEAGKYYRISADASLYRDDPVNATCPQTFEIKCGMYNDPEGLNTVVVPTTSIDSPKFRRVDGWFVPRLSGTYYIGIHGTSPAYSSYYNYLFIDNISIEAARESTVPSQVTDIALTNDPDGSTRIDIAFKAPKTDLGGGELTDNMSVTVSRDGALLTTLENIRPGQQCTLSDTPQEGEHTYSFRASNAHGEGTDTYVTRYAGSALPLAPAIISASETPSHQLYCHWTPPATDINGNAINADKITYNVYVYNVTSGEIDLAASEISATEYTASINGANEQQFFATPLISANFNGKESEMAVGDMLPVGPPYMLPYRNSFTYDDYEKYLMAVEQKDNAIWRMLDDYSDPASQDGDNGYISMICNEPDETCELTFGKIDLTGASHPALSFYTYIYEFDDNEININITDCDSGQKATVKSVVLSSIGHTGWVKILCPLDSYSGKTITVGLDGTIRTHGYIPVDNMRLEQLPSTDYALGDITYPRGVEIDSPFEISAQIFNYGHDASSPYSALLKRDGKTICSVEGPAVEPLQTAEVKFTDVLSVGANPCSSYVIEIETESDGNPEDNTSEPFNINMIVPTYPVATNLTLTGTGDNVTLQWEAPDMSKGAPDTEIEDFESYEAFDTDLEGKWSMIDADGGYVGGFQNLDMPLTGTRQAWWVMTNESPYDFLWPHSGSNILTQMYGLSDNGREEVPSDDWIISPELYGGCQTISFWASSLTSDYGLETMEIYSSANGTDINDMELIREQFKVPAEWTQFFVYLPAGTRHFAIRATTPAGYMLRLDDISYVPAGTPIALNLKGYNAYRNGEKLNDSPITANSFTTSQTTETDTYFVTAVYDLGESAASNVVGFNLSGIELPTVGSTNAPVEFYDLSGKRIISPNLAPGFYIRRQGTSISKIFVR